MDGESREMTWQELLDRANHLQAELNITRASHESQLSALREELDRAREVVEAAKYLKKNCDLGLVPTMGAYGQNSWNSGDEALARLTDALSKLGEGNTERRAKPDSAK